MIRFTSKFGVLVALLISFQSFSQQLMINEVSQGSGSSEYVEFVVIGAPICPDEVVPCIDLRKVIIDDNNGFFAPGVGTGIAGGALRFSNDALWSCVPQGTYIVVYNEANPNTDLPADDASLTDGNCTLILPGNSPLLESTSVSPTASPFNPLYPTLDSDWVPSVGWNVVAMANGDDSFQIPNLGVNGTPLHSVSWGNNNTNGNTIIYFTGSVSGKVITFVNSTDNDWNLQANWVINDVAGNQSPGAANSIQNDTWIGTMNPNCRVNPLLSFAVTNADCAADNGAIDMTVNNISSYSVSWETGSTQDDISNLAADTYTVTVTDQSTGCILVDSATVQLNSGNLLVNTTITDETCSSLCDGTVSYIITGGQTPYTVVWRQNSVIIPEPTAFCAGSYQIEVSDANGCEITESVVVASGITANYSLSNDTIICLGDSVTLFVTNADNAVWANPSLDADQITVSPTQTTAFSVVITENTCVFNESITVNVTNCNFGIEFPNVFTPDGDKVNDVYVPIKLAGLDILEFVILNRWGQVMYETTSETIAWNGQISGGRDASEGVYFYKARYSVTGGNEVTLHGFIELIRK